MIFKSYLQLILLSLAALLFCTPGSAIANIHTYSVVFGVWNIEDRASNSLGFLEFFEANVDVPQGKGQLSKNAGFFASKSNLDIRVLNKTREAWDFNVNFVSRSSRRQSQGRMLISLKGVDRNVLDGSIELDGRFILVTLKRQKKSALNAFNKQKNGEEHDDLPAFGVSGPAYRLRNVPEGKNLLVRARPDRSSKIIASLGVFTSVIFVINCSPRIDHAQFDKTNKQGKRELLGGSWCLIRTSGPDMRDGYVLGRYLDPILKR